MKRSFTSVFVLLTILSLSYTLEIFTLPSRVDVYSNDILIGNSGRDGEIVLNVEGRISLTFVKPGYWTKTIDLVISTSTTLRVELDPLVKGEIETTPPGALLFVDGIKIGESPYSGDLPLGSHEIRAVKPGYGEIEKVVRISENSRIDLKLIEYGTVRFISEIPCVLFVDSEYLGTPPATAVLTPGNHTIFMLTEWGSIVHSFQVKQREILKTLILPLGMSCVEISTNPEGAWVVIDGWAGKTPDVFCGKPGRYELNVFKTGYEPLKEELEVSEGFSVVALSLKKLEYQVEVRSDVEAEVYLNGVLIGKTPLRIGVPEGFSDLVIVSGDRVWYERILGGYDKDVEVFLRKKATLIFSGDDGVEYRLEGITVSAGSVLHVDRGTYELEIDLGKKATMKYRLNLKAGELLLVSSEGIERVPPSKMIDRR